MLSINKFLKLANCAGSPSDTRALKMGLFKTHLSYLNLMKRILTFFTLAILLSFTAHAQSITVTYPNGGENLDGCTVQTVTWAAAGTSNNYSIDYSIDNGSNWTSVASFYFTTNGTFDWTLPNVTSSNCLIRVYDSNAPAVVDQSDATFSINGPLTLLTPNGGENWVAGSSYTVSWAASGTSNIYDLEYSTNNGATWVVFANNINGSSGSYSWTVPNLNSNQALVRITDINNSPCVSDKSDGTFNMISEITLTSPNGGENYAGAVYSNGGNYNMDNTPVTASTGNFFDSGGPTGNYSYNQNLTKTFYPDVPENKLRFVFTDFRTAYSQHYLRIYDGPNTSSPLIGTYSSTNNPGTVNSTHKTGALTFQWISNSSSSLQRGWEAYFTSIGPGTQTLSWNYTGTSQVYDIEYSTNSGLSWTRIVTNVPSAAGTFPWPVPNTPSAFARVRILDNDNNLITDESDADFTIGAATPYYQICEANGGETWFAGENYDITWGSAFVSGPNVRIEYSTDNGTTWLLVTSTTINDGSYTWTVPNTPSSTALIQISEVGNAANNDQSDAVFTIAPHVTLTSPNGAESLIGCNSHSVTWSTGGTSDFFDIDFSSDGGVTWVNVVSNLQRTTNYATYAWTVNNVSTTNALLAVTDHNNPAFTDTSDAVFSVASTARVIVNQPNGGEFWVAGSTYPITYALSGGVTNVKIEYSLDSGMTWTNIATNTSGGSYNWTVPNQFSDEAYIRISDVSNPCNHDLNNTLFNMVSEVTVTGPNGGETFTANGGLNGGMFLMNSTPVTVTTGNFFDSGGETGNYSYNQNITKTFTPFNPSHKLQVVFTAFRTAYSQHYLRIYDGPNTSSPLLGTYSSTSNPGTVTSTHKSGALTFQWITNSSSSLQFGWEAYINSISPDNEDITWNLTGTSGVYNIEYSTNGGSTWNRIISEYPSSTGTYSWPVPNTPTTQAKVRILDDDNALIVDESDANFTIDNANPLYILCEPNGGEIWYADDTENITWSSVFIQEGNVKLEYSTDNGTTWIQIVASTINDGTHPWLVPDTPSPISLVRVSGATIAANQDVSDAVFTLAPHVTITSPNGAEVLTGCTTHNITWNTGGTSDVFNLEYSTNSGTTWLTIINGLTRTNSNASYAWTVANANSTNCLIRVYDQADISKGDTSDAVFTINPTLNVQLASPNGGENWVAGNTYQITYNLQGGVTNVNLEYSLDNGVTWVTITNNTSGGAYNWIVPNVDSDQALVRVTDVGNTCNSATSAAVLSLISEVEITTPNGGETFTANGGPNGGSFNMNSTPVTLTTGNFYDSGGPTGNYSYNQNITKTFSPYNPSHKLQVVFTDFRTAYSQHYLRIYDGPNTSSPLIGSYNSTNNPGTVTSTHKSGALTFQWITNSSSSLQRGWSAYINSLSPDNVTVNWNITGTSGVYNLEYSTNSGTTWNRIITEYPATVGTYSWPVPNTPSTTAQFRVVDEGNSLIQDATDANFTINTALPMYLVCEPNGGETWFAGETENILWGSAFTTEPNVKLEYSTDNGSNWVTIISSTFNDGTYAWLVPDTPSPISLVKVSGATLPTNVDSSDAVFTLAPHVTVTSPNGAEVLTGCTNHNITWSTGGTSNFFNLEYSTDSGVTWITIINNLQRTTNFASYTWTVANANSNNCLIRVYDNADISKGDTSDAVFTINPTLNVQLSSPNGGESWVAGNTYQITYTLQGGVTNVKLEYSLDNGVSWIQIASNTNGGAYNWVVPNVDSDQALVRVSDVGNTCNSATSAAVFSLISEIDLVDPNGGQTFTANGGPNGGSFNMNSTPVTVTTGNFYDSGGPTGNYSYNQNITKTFTPYNPSHKLQIVFTDFRTAYSQHYLRIYNGPNTSSPLIGTYSSTNNPGTVTSTHKTGALTFQWISNSSSSLQRGWSAYINSLSTDNVDVDWNITGTSEVFNLEYSTNSGTTWNRIITEYPATVGTYSWPVPNTPSTTAKFRVVDEDNNLIQDQSATDFTINTALPLYLICEPNGGETWFAGDIENILWGSAFITEPNVQLEYSTDQGTTWLQITNSTFNDGTYAWTVPNTPSPISLVRVSGANFPANADSSDAVFTLAPHVTVTSPNGAEVLTGCTTHNITWSTGGTSDVFNLDYSTNSGATWLPIATNLARSQSFASYSWTVANANSSSCLVRIYDVADPTKGDTSDAVFTINPTLNVQLGQPNGGQNWVAGNIEPIIYTLAGGVTNVKIEFSTDNGISWTTITNNTSGGIYNWTVPNVDSDQALIRVTDIGNSCNAAISSAVFNLISEVTILAPNGGDTLKAITGTNGGSFNMSNTPVTLNSGNFYDSGGPTGNYSYNQNITKTFTPDVPTHKLRVVFTDFRTAYSQHYLRIYDGPNTSSPLVGTYSSTNNPGTVTSTHKSGALTFQWISNSSSSLQRGWKAYIHSISPDNANIDWNIVGTSGVYNLEYSIDGGTIWNRIISEYPSITGDFSWPIPNTPTNSARFRVMDYDNNTIVDGSDADFVIEPADPMFVICEPNGGETYYAGSSQDILWGSAFVATGTVKLEYSTDAGTTWQLIVASTANDGSYTWIVPYDPSDSALVRVSDPTAPSVMDVSDSLFRLGPYVEMIAPNGGESLIGCSSYTITWGAGGTTGIYNLEYSTDGGTTWKTIQNNYSTSATIATYNWTVANENSSNMLVRVYDVGDLSKIDESDAPFTITPIFHVQLNSPNGGEFWVSGTSQNIIYNLSGGVSNVRIEYSLDSGATYQTITSNTSGGAYAWTIPNTPSTTCLIKVTDVSNSCKFDVSQAVFSIVSEIAITSPNGGEVWQGYVGTPGGDYIMSNTPVTCNSGNFFDSGGETGNYSYNQNITKTFYPDVPTNKIQVTFTDFRTAYSQHYLRIYNGPNTSSPLIGTYSSTNNPGTVTSTHSTGALTFQWITNSSSSLQRGWEAYINTVGSPTQSLTWGITGTSGEFDIEYSTDGGTSWTRIVTEYPSATGFWPWQVPNQPSSICLVRIIDSNNGNILDVSDNFFEISPGIPVLVTPNGAETAFSGIGFEIVWSAPSFLSPNVQLEYSTDAGTSWSLIEAFTFNDGTYTWFPPTTLNPLPNSLVRVSESGNTLVNDVSDAVFTISPAIQIVNPNGNSGNWRGCTQSTIDWVAGATTNYLIELSVDSGATWATVESNYVNTNSVVNYVWSIPNTPSTNCLVRVTDNNFPTRTDISDSVFTITPTITLTNPSFGGQIQAGTNFTITWVSTVVSNFYDIDFSTDGGTSWTNIVTNHFTTSDDYLWTVPSTLSPNCLIRVRDNLDNCKEDQSDFPFTIQAATPSITVTTPNGGENLSGCGVYNITWSELTTSNFYDIEFSEDAGNSWSPIVSNHFTTGGSYAWTVPNINSGICLVRITDAADINKTDVSDQTFTIAQSVTANITPSGATDICIGDTVFLTSDSLNGNSWFPGGQTTQTIAVTTSGTYTVTVTDAGCAATSLPITVTVNSLPATPTISASGSTTICDGDNVILTSSSASGNSWTPGLENTQDISVTMAGSYSVTVTNQFGCTATSAPEFINVNPVPASPTAGSNSPVTEGNPIDLTATTVPGATYEWSGPLGYTSSLQNPSIAASTVPMSGTYTVTASQNGCTSPGDDVVVVVNPPGTTVNVAGTVLSENGDSVRTVTITRTGTGPAASIVTGLNGAYSMVLDSGAPYTLTPSKNDDVTTNNGITTLDIIMMRRHILHEDTLASPYKILAGDVNFSNNISTLDIVLTRTVILQTSLTFPNNMLWTFVNSDYVFPNPIQPWPYEDDRSYLSATAQTGQDFVGVKLGDVNNTWDHTVAKTQIVGELGFDLKDQSAPQSSEIRIPVTVRDFNEISGYQFTIEWLPEVLEYVGIEHGKLEGHFGETRVAEGKLSTSWDDVNGKSVTLADGEVAFELVFRAKGDVGAESHVWVGHSMTSPEGYTDDLDLLTLSSHPAKVTVGAAQEPAALDNSLNGFALGQNFPNPFDESTEITFQVPEEVEVYFSIFDLNGHEVRGFKGVYAEGTHSVTWDGRGEAGERVASGVYYIRMIARDFSATGKMIYMRP